MNPHCLKLGGDVEEMGPYRPSCCDVGYFETIQVRGVWLVRMIAGAHHETWDWLRTTTTRLPGMARSGKLAGYANSTRDHMIESAS
jgi:hypothetical protein